MKFCAGVFAGATLVALGIAWLLWVTVISGFDFRGWGDSPYRWDDIQRAQYPAPPLWSPDGARIAFNADGTLHFIDAAGADLRSFSFPIDESQGDRARRLNHAMSVSSEGMIAYTHSEPSSLLKIKTASFDAQELRQLTKPTSFDTIHPVWSPDGSRLALFLSDSLTVIELEDLAYTFVLPTNLPFRVEKEPPVWSPDGQKVAFIASPDNENNQMVYTVNVDGTNLQRLSETVARPAWSPDGERIAFMQNANGASSIYTVRPDGTGLDEIASFPDALPERRGSPLLLGRAPRGFMSWSRDGSSIRIHQAPFVVIDSNRSKLRIMDARPGALAAWSPKGDRIAALFSDSLAGVRLFTMNADGSDKRVLVERNPSNDRKAIDTPWVAAQGRPAPAGFERFVWREVTQ